MNYYDFYFAVASICTIAVAGLIMLSLMYILAILRDVKKISRIAKKEAEFIGRSISKGVGILGTELSSEAAGFLRTLFTLLISQFPGFSGKPKKSKIKSI